MIVDGMGVRLLDHFESCSSSGSSFYCAWSQYIYAIRNACHWIPLHLSSLLSILLRLSRMLVTALKDDSTMIYEESIHFSVFVCDSVDGNSLLLLVKDFVPADYDHR